MKAIKNPVRDRERIKVDKYLKKLSPVLEENGKPYERPAQELNRLPFSRRHDIFHCLTTKIGKKCVSLSAHYIDVNLKGNLGQESMLHMRVEEKLYIEDVTKRKLVQEFGQNCIFFLLPVCITLYQEIQ